MSGASNVTGFISPIHEVAELAHRHGALVSVDAAQLAPHRRIDIRPAGDPGHLDFVSFSGHKMYAPYGAGVLVAPRDFFSGAPEVMGGGAIRIVTWDDTVWADLPDREEAGSPNVIGAVALGVAIETLVELGFDDMLRHEAELGGRLIKSLSEIPGVEVLGGPEAKSEPERLGLASFVIDGVHHGLAAAALSHEWGVAVRNGCFCANPYVFHLLNMSKEAVETVEGEVAADRRTALPGAVRASLAPYNDEAEVDRFADAVRHVAGGKLNASYEQASDGTFAPDGRMAGDPKPAEVPVEARRTENLGEVVDEASGRDSAGDLPSPHRLGPVRDQHRRSYRTWAVSKQGPLDHHHLLLGNRPHPLRASGQGSFLVETVIAHRSERERSATRALVLGLLALPFGIFAPFAIWAGLSSLRRIRKSEGRSAVKARPPGAFRRRTPGAGGLDRSAPLTGSWRREDPGLRAPHGGRTLGARGRCLHLPGCGRGLDRHAIDATAGKDRPASTGALPGCTSSIPAGVSRTSPTTRAAWCCCTARSRKG